MNVSYSTQRNPQTGATITFRFEPVARSFGAGFEQCSCCKAAAVMRIAAVTPDDRELIPGTENSCCGRHRPTIQVKIAKRQGVL